MNRILKGFLFVIIYLVYILSFFLVGKFVKSPVTQLTLICILVGILGGAIGYFIFRKKNREYFDMKDILKNPNKLKLELLKHGKIVDAGEEIKIDVITNKFGNPELQITKTPVEIPKEDPKKTAHDLKDHKKGQMKKPDFFSKVLKGGYYHEKSRR